LNKVFSCYLTFEAGNGFGRSVLAFKAYGAKIPMEAGSVLQKRSLYSHSSHSLFLHLEKKVEEVFPLLLFYSIPD